MSQVRTITLRTENETVDLDALVASLESNNPGVTVNVWKKKGKHSKKTEAETVVAA